MWRQWGKTERDRRRNCERVVKLRPIQVCSFQSKESRREREREKVRKSMCVRER
jgi:hypothetical protein